MYLSFQRSSQVKPSVVSTERVLLGVIHLPEVLVLKVVVPGRVRHLQDTVEPHDIQPLISMHLQKVKVTSARFSDQMGPEKESL